MRFAKTLFASFSALVSFGTHAVEVNVQPDPVQGITILSADIARDLESSTETLVVRLRNDAEATGQTLTLAAFFRDENGNGKGLHAKQFQVEVLTGGVQAISQPLPSYLEGNDVVTVELVDVANWSPRDP
jgi:hypothetical protein